MNITMMAYHLYCLRKHCWKTEYSVSPPRIHPSENGGFQSNIMINDRELTRVTFAMRIFGHDADISYSTRKSTEFRNHMTTLGMTTVSAESKTEPGGCLTYPQALGQLRVNNEREAAETDATLHSLGRIPVHKGWDTALTLTQC